LVSLRRRSLNWSYPRTDISRQDQATIALALREEIADLKPLVQR